MGRFDGLFGYQRKGIIDAILRCKISFFLGQRSTEQLVSHLRNESTMPFEKIEILWIVHSYTLCLRSIYLGHAKNGVECVRLREIL